MFSDKKIVISIMLVCVMIFSPYLSYGESLDDEMNSVIGSLDFSGLEGISLTLSKDMKNISVRDAVKLLASGKNISLDDLLSEMFYLFTQQTQTLGNLAMAMIIPVVLSSLLSIWGSNRKSFQLLGKNLGLLVILVPIVLVVIDELEHVKSTITVTTEKMDTILPLMLTLLTAVGGNASSAFLHPVVLAASGSMVYLSREVILRLVMCTCVATTVNHLSGRAHMTRIVRLLKGAVCWLLGVSFTVFLGTMSVQGMCSASIDGVAIRAAKYAIDNFVPVVGGMFSDTMDTIVGCTLIVKNALGVTAVLVLAGSMLLPLVRTLATAAVMKLCAALLEPIAQPATIDAIEDFSGVIVLFLITMLCVCTMYFLLIVQMLLVGNLTVMLR